MSTDLHLPDSQLPPYHLDSSPTYSECPALSEVSLHPEPFSPEISATREHWICETKHMRIDLGPYIWGLSAPSYGLNGTVVGSLKFLDLRQHVESVTISFEGRLTAFRPYRGSSGDTSTCILSHTFPLFTSSSGSTFNWDEEHTFSVPIPPEVNIPGGGIAPTPPSFNSYYYGSALEVSYTIKVDMVLKGSNLLKKHETKVIPVYYLPKSRPSESPLITIPRPNHLNEETETYLHWLNRVHSTSVTPAWSNSKCKSLLTSFTNSVFFSIPSPLEFCSGQDIPFAITFAFPRDPAQAKLLTQCIRVDLLKRIVFPATKKPFGSAEESEHRQWVLTSGTLRHQNEFAEGIRMLRGDIKAGGCGKGTSWMMGSAGVQYVIHLSVIPPKHLADHIPNFESETIVCITTDQWDPLSFSHCAINGIPTPAVGLASDPQANWVGSNS